MGTAKHIEACAAGGSAFDTSVSRKRVRWVRKGGCSVHTAQPAADILTIGRPGSSSKFTMDLQLHFADYFVYTFRCLWMGLVYVPLILRIKNRAHLRLSLASRTKFINSFKFNSMSKNAEFWPCYPYPNPSTNLTAFSAYGLQGPIFASHLARLCVAPKILRCALAIDFDFDHFPCPWLTSEIPIPPLTSCACSLSISSKMVPTLLCALCKAGRCEGYFSLTKRVNRFIF